MKWPMLCALLLALGGAPLSAADEPRTYRNPILQEGHPADPHVLLHEGLYYLYATTHGRGYDVLTSKDLVHWEKRGTCFTDPRGGAWAPDVYHHPEDGKFYLYHTLNRNGPDDPSHAKIVGVAVAESPLGPFVNDRTLADAAIDAHLFRDEDGKLYFYYVSLSKGFRIMAVPMANPTTMAGQAREVLRPEAAWEKAQGEVTEGPWMLKHAGRYYLMYSGSGANGPDYAIGYATADSPLGPFTRYPGNPIVHRGDGIFGPGHHCVVPGPDGKLWMVYHQQRTQRRGWDRFLAIDPIRFDANGVLHATPTRGTEQPAP